MNLLRKCSLLGLLVGLVGACSSHTAQEVRLEGRTTVAGHQYSVFHPQGLAIRVVTVRPDAADSRNQLSVAAAYTDLDTDQPLDLLVCNGRVLQPKATVWFLDGALTVVGDSLTIVRIPHKQSVPGAELERVRQQHGTLLLQELLVFEGRNVHADGGSVFQRRALVQLANRQFAVVESVSDYLTMKQFGDDLLELGARKALYLDMGGWDEGWYRAGSQVVKLGRRRTDTARQSNWLVFARRPAEK
ncbi:phosphodiester glycosidase family protein [Hymenobacter armeniacus]|uniref:Phosphodiester glycosidase family protein n=1 Tax=Hymenobacter armeniacus TaxID=2771358 RepID=A0ABR8JRI4_9BACT|nr:phosphodiester glycosidase family protein [Hymenobacter armeniacus]MBD2721172.1 phosphodiester glycosidase family protein [Hymenobacter armeniacus]